MSRRPEVVRQIHRGHPADVDLALDAIALSEDRGEACGDIGVHGAAEAGVRTNGGQPNRGPNACTRGKARSFGPSVP